MLIIPAIDLKGGSCVRLYKGVFENELFRKDPLETALSFKKAGAKRLHIIDLDGAREGRPVNLQIALAIKSKTNLEIEFGGGIRSMEVLEELLSTNLDYLIITTLFLKERKRLKKERERLIISIDVDEGGFLKTHGWQKREKVKGWEVLEEAISEGFENFIITFTHKDGTLEGLDKELIEKFTKHGKARIIFAGGVSSIKDIEKAKSAGAFGLIIGRAFYEGVIPFEVIKDVS